MAIFLFSSAPAYADTGTPASGAQACHIPAELPKEPNAFQHFMWQIFVAANCASNKEGSPRAWETWAEQTCLLHGGQDCTNQEGQQRLHASVLASRTRDLPALCQPMTSQKTTQNNALLPFVPKNLSANPQFCEEVHVNQAESDFITSPKGRNVKYSLQTLPGQSSYIYSNGPLSLPKTSIEIKADWLPASSINPGFSCDNKPVDFYVEKNWRRMLRVSWNAYYLKATPELDMGNIRASKHDHQPQSLQPPALLKLRRSVGLAIREYRPTYGQDVATDCTDGRGCAAARILQLSSRGGTNGVSRSEPRRGDAQQFVHRIQRAGSSATRFMHDMPFLRGLYQQH